mmetsp:Transcript_1071/g.2272  ORF Transcript_1071/g.2272 Transcript_1071/m.2272 type:complete len:99 (+) Transcript_1071:610-906(+)
MKKIFSFAPPCHCQALMTAPSWKGKTTSCLDVIPSRLYYYIYHFAALLDSLLNHYYTRTFPALFIPTQLQSPTCPAFAPPSLSSTADHLHVSGGVHIL